MRKTILVRLSASVVLLLGAWIAYTQTPQSPPNKIDKLKDDFYVIVGNGGNVAAYVTGEGVILIDDKFEPDFNDIVAKVKSVTSQPIKYVLNTHHHGDHTGSNAKFLPTTQIIAHANARANMIQGKQPGAPAVVFSEETAVFLGGKEVRMRYFGRGHTNGDAMVYFPALRTIHTGDLMAGNSPLIDYGGGGSVVDWTKTLDAAMKLDFDTVIPGHGKVTNKAGLLAYRDNVEKLRNRVSGLIREGKGQDDVGKVVMAEYGWAAGSLNMQWSLPGMMTKQKK